jgi:hypothetical protein
MITTRYPREDEPTTIDLTPTWCEILPLLIEVAANGATIEGRRNAMTELQRMARAADEYLAQTRAAASTADEA